MNKQMIEALIPAAYTALEKNKEICREGKIARTFKNNIAAFGAAIQMGNLLSAIAFFSQQGEASKPRQELLKVILDVLKTEKKVEPNERNLFEYVKGTEDRERAKILILNAAVSIKLAMNLFELESESKGGSKNEEGDGVELPNRI